MKKVVWLVVCIFFTCLVYAQKPIYVAEYVEMTRPIITDKYFSDIETLKSILLKRKIVKKFNLRRDVDANLGSKAYVSWQLDNENDYDSEIDGINGVGVVISQKTIGPNHLMNYMWQTCCHLIDDKQALNLTIQASNCDAKHYNEFCQKVLQTLIIFDITLSSEEQLRLKNKKCFIAEKNGFTFYLDNGMYGDDWERGKVSFVIIPPIKLGKKIYKINEQWFKDDPKFIIKYDTLGLETPQFEIPFNNADSLKELLIANGFITEKHLEIFPMYYSLEPTDTTVFLLTPGSNLNYNKIPAGNKFIIHVCQHYADISSLAVSISYNTQPSAALIEENVNKLIQLFTLLNIELSNDMLIWLKSAAATDENTPIGLKIPFKGGEVNFSIRTSIHQAKIEIKPNYIMSTPVFVPYKSGSK